MIHSEHDFAVTERRFGDVLMRDHFGPAEHCRLADGRGLAHLCFLVQGSFTERRRGRRVERGAGSVRMSPSGDEHDVLFGRQGGRCLMVQLPLEVMHAVDAPTFVASRELSLLCRSLLVDFHDPGPSSQLAVEGAALELFALVRRRAKPHGRARPAWLDGVRDALEDAAPRVPRLDELARAASVHPAHLARAFHDAFGCTVGDYARRVRLRRVLDRIALTGAPLAHIAHEFGYVDQSHMSRDVKRATGLAPGALRRQSLAPRKG